MTRLVIALCFLISTSGLMAASSQAESKRTAQDTFANTDPNDNFWRDVPPVIADRDGFGNPVPGHRTEIRSRWNSSNLFFLFVCPYQQLNLKPDPKTDTETNELWKWDVAEVFIGTDFQNIRRYKEFEVSPQGEWVDLNIDLDAPRHEDGWVWNSAFKSAARIDRTTETWYCFMRIPYSMIDSRPAAAGNALRINFFRSQGAPPNHKSIAWQPTHRPTFHVPEAFGTLKLVN